MINLSRTIISLAILITMGTFQHASAAGPFCPAAKAKASDQNQKMATYSIPDMDMAVVHKLVKAIADQPGISLATPDLENMQFSVVYDNSKLEQAKLLEAITTVSANSKLIGVSAAPAPANPSKHAGCSAAERAKCAKTKAEKAAEQPAESSE